MMPVKFELEQLALPGRPDNGHKGSFGRVLVVAGSAGMSGAACLAATAALRGGAGLVTAAVPASIQQIVASYEPAYMTVGLPCDNTGHLSVQSASEIPVDLPSINSIAVGPGLGRSRPAADLVSSLIWDCGSPLVLDADALNLTAEHEMLRGFSGATPVVVTPHPGEFARLTGQSIASIEANREEFASQFARDHNVVVVLKGPATIVSDGARLYVNTTGNAGMATGGSGDVLTGLLAAQLAQLRSPFEAAVLAVWLHGLAGDLAVAESSPEALISSDLLNFFGAAWNAARRHFGQR